MAAHNPSNNNQTSSPSSFRSSPGGSGGLLSDLVRPRRNRVLLAAFVSWGMGLAMLGVGATSVEQCDNSSTEEQYNIPVWLTVAGGVLLLVPFVYFIYDKYCKDEGGGPLIKKAANILVVTYLLIGLVLAVVGFVWVFGSVGHQACGQQSFTYRFAFGTLILLNVIMDIWICFKICVVLHWAFLYDEDPVH